MKQKKDTRFWLTTFSEEQEQTKHEYKSFKREIETSKKYDYKIVNDTVENAVNKIEKIIEENNA